MSKRARKLEKIYEKMEVELIEKDIKKLISGEERKCIKYAPSYQRNYVWTEAKATNLIETVLMNGIVPPLIALKRGKQKTIIDRKTKI